MFEHTEIINPPNPPVNQGCCRNTQRYRFFPGQFFQKDERAVLKGEQAQYNLLHLKLQGRKEFRVVQVSEPDKRLPDSLAGPFPLRDGMVLLLLRDPSLYE